MDNTVIFAAAGHGKTYSLCEQARTALVGETRQVLMISYTNEGLLSLENEYRKQNSGVLDSRVVFKTWYSFLLSEFIKPYQCLLQLKCKHYKNEYPFPIPENFVSAIAFYEKEQPQRWFKQNHVQYFLNKHCDVIPDRAGHLAILCNEHSDGKVIARMEQIYFSIFIDELQDYAGWDLEIIKALFESRIQIQCVGDHKQSTFRTNNSPKNSQYREYKIRNYFINLEKLGLCKVLYQNTTRRFNKEICDYINTIQKDEDAIVIPDSSCKNTNYENSGVFVISEKNLSDYCYYYHPTILRYDRTVKIKFLHNCEILNYGGSKGTTFNRVVIIPVGTVIPFIINQEKITSNQTMAKFYVACTRARISVVFAIELQSNTPFFKQVKMILGNKEITAYKYSPTISD